MPYYQLFYHLVWSTKKRQPLLTPKVESVIHNFLRAKAIGLGANVYALNGVEDHVHLLVSIPPKIAVSKFVGQVKAVASTKFNKSGLSDRPFFWQEAYGAFSFDAKRLLNYMAYVNRQKEHHARRTIIPVLERMVSDDSRVIREPTIVYAIEEPDWRRELENWDSPIK